MVKQRLIISLMIAMLLSLIVVGFALAGSEDEIGQVQGTPPVGELNYFAWLDKPENILVEGMPNQILTEEHYKSELGLSGYQDLGGPLYWFMQVKKFDNATHNDPVRMIFGGLGASSGKLWFYEFLWNNSESETMHNLIPLSTTQTEACPVVTFVGYDGPNKAFNFSHLPNSSYHVYRATEPSGADNQLSNGSYYYLQTVSTDESGIGSFTDSYDGESWYLVIRADPTTNELVGCHSVPAYPTNVVMGEFTAIYDDLKSAVVLEWETVSETNIIGFNVFRGISDKLVESVKINADVVPAEHIGSPVGDVYSFEDFGIEDGQTYYYWIEILKSNGTGEKVGPESVTIPAAGWFYYFLPTLFN